MFSSELVELNNMKEDGAITRLQYVRGVSALRMKNHLDMIKKKWRDADDIRQFLRE